MGAAGTTGGGGLVIGGRRMGEGCGAGPWVGLGWGSLYNLSLITT